ncbi:MAG: hypothetical protein WC759_04615 [Candidatus Micrarchaeia archaeon]|jgi:hypothetical protein
MPTEKEINEIIAWCEARKKQRKRALVIERNEFAEKIDWMLAKTLIEIDMPLERADKHALVYDSVMKCLWEWRNGEWARITPG